MARAARVCQLPDAEPTAATLVNLDVATLGNLDYGQGSVLLIVEDGIRSLLWASLWERLKGLFEPPIETKNGGGPDDSIVLLYRVHPAPWEALQSSYRLLRVGSCARVFLIELAEVALQPMDLGINGVRRITTVVQDGVENKAIIW